MSIKVYYLYSQLSDFCKNLGDVNEKESKHFYQDIKVMEEHYQGQ